MVEGPMFKSCSMIELIGASVEGPMTKLIGALVKEPKIKLDGALVEGPGHLCVNNDFIVLHGRRFRMLTLSKLVAKFCVSQFQ